MRNLPKRSKEKTFDSDCGIRYTVRRSLRRTCQITVEKDGSVILRMPLLSSDAEAEDLVVRHQRWIRKRLEAQKTEAAEGKNLPKLTETEKRAIKRNAQKVIPERVALYAQIAGVDYGKISYRFQRTRWGSCTKKGDLSFNCMLMLAPPEVLDSVIVHELCHRKVMNHSAQFYQEVFKIYPGYKSCRAWLKKHGRELVERI